MIAVSDDSDFDQEILTQVIAESKAMAERERNAVHSESGAGSSTEQSVYLELVYCLVHAYSVLLYRTLNDVIVSLSAKLDPDEFKFEVRRDHILEDLLPVMKSKDFHPMKTIYTEFVGERGKDAGGLTRELWCYLARDIHRFCEGKPHCKLPRHDALKLQVCTVPEHAMHFKPQHQFIIVHQGHNYGMVP